MIFRSTTPYIDTPIKGLYQSLIDDANDKATYIDGETGKKLTLNEIKSNSKKLAAGLIDKAGFKRGDVLAIVSPNQIDYPVVLFSAIAAGGKVTFINPMFKEDELVHQLKDSGTKYIIVFPSLLSKIIKATKDDELNISKSNIFLFGDKEIDGIKPYSFLISEREVNPVEYSPEEAKSTTAYLCYSSGTTGKNKGVEITHSNIITSILSQVHYDNNDINSNSILIGALPLSHLYGLIVFVHLTLLKGATVVIIPDPDFSTFCRIIQDYKINVIHTIPSVISSLVNDPISKKYNLSSLKSCISAAAPLSRTQAENFNKIFGIKIRQYFGSTEAQATHIARADDDNSDSESVGRLIPNLECKIISKKGEVGYNEPGELYIRGPSIMKGYLNNKEETDACINNEGWFRTGDIAKVDESGNFYVIGRVEEMINYEGQQVPPAELESILTAHPSIDDAAVIGVPAGDDEYPTAYVVLKQNNLKSNELKQEIKNFVAERVAPHKELRGGVFFINKIPKSSSGKILRRKLGRKTFTKLEYKPYFRDRRLKRVVKNIQLDMQQKKSFKIKKSENFSAIFSKFS